MPSLVSRWLRTQIHLIKPVLTRLEVSAGRTAQDQLGALASRVLKNVVDYIPVRGWDDTAACWAEPKEREGRRGVVLYLHGGGYVAGSLKYAQLFGGVLAARCGLPVFCLAYALAPEHPYPAALEDALRAYRHLLDTGHSPGEVIVAGESAGGGLALCLIHRLREEGLPQPAGLVSISPWTDLTLSGESYRYNARHEVSLSRPQLEYYVSCYAPPDVTVPTVSPGLHSFEGFPPALLFAGGDEILLSDARAVLRGYVKAGVPCRLVIGKGMWHAYPLYPGRESARALDLIDAFIGRHIGGSGPEGLPYP